MRSPSSCARSPFDTLADDELAAVVSAAEIEFHAANTRSSTRAPGHRTMCGSSAEGRSS